MKKLFTVLAVLLVASVAFAAVIKGDVSASYKFDFDAKTLTYGKPGVGSLDATLNFDPTEAVIIGDAEATHIEAKVLASADLMINDGNNHDDGYMPFKAGTDYFWYASEDFGDNALYAAITFKVGTFKIVAKNWSIDFINGLKLNFAKSAIDTVTYHEGYAEENTQNFSVDNTLKGVHNMTVTAFGYQFGFGVGTPANKTWDDALNFALTAKTPEYDFNGVKVQAGAAYEVKNCVWKLAGSAKVAYATDKLSVSAAYDAVKEAGDFVDNEIAVNFAYAPVTVDVYFANENSETEDDYNKYFALGFTDKLPSNYLSAKVVVDVAKVAENVPVTVTLTGKNLINKEKQNLSVVAETTIVPNFKFGAYFKDWCDFDGTDYNHRKLGATVEFTGVEKLTLNAEVAYALARNEGNKKFFGLVGAKYAHELFTASAEIGMEKEYEQDAKFGADATVKSTKLVDGAELSAKALFNLNDLHDTIDVKKQNSLTLACKVSF